ncbi:uncharacterized protein LOC132637509 [Lycium barbarum]|uniref:uncharacterized protein LOC132637509 n=1 Tax=Lycium barbarum TaxID=112863 RepID=UPI00293E6B35|nr:uncharacterized protein LOC132637509 [Lycium barbarum]
MLKAPFTAYDVKMAIWAIGGDKSTDPDGFGSQFFKNCLPIVGIDITVGVLEFFETREMLKSAFVASRTIIQNILICHDQVRLYNRYHTNRSCLMKIDLRKAYDSVEWGFEQEILYGLNFVVKFIKWIMEYITTTQYTIALNGGLHGLNTNAAKSNMFTANMDHQVIKDICALTGYKRGKLQFKYLGVPTNSKRLNVVDCEMMVEKMIARAKIWRTRNLSYVERVQLVNYVLLHIQSYWSTIFLLPKQVSKDITAICRNFL